MTTSSPSYAFTSAKNAPKYSPIRNARPGANNVPMSYAGPPTQEEINRNRGRLHHANAYSQRNGPAYQETEEPRRAVVLSYTPPQSKGKPPSSRRPQLTSQNAGSSSRNHVYASERQARTMPSTQYQHV